MDFFFMIVQFLKKEVFWEHGNVQYKLNIIEIYKYKVVDMKGEDLDVKWIL